MIKAEDGRSRGESLPSQRNTSLTIRLLSISKPNSPRTNNACTSALEKSFVSLLHRTPEAGHVAQSQSLQVSSEQTVFDPYVLKLRTVWRVLDTVLERESSALHCPTCCAQPRYKYRFCLYCSTAASASNRSRKGATEAARSIAHPPLMVYAAADVPRCCDLSIFEYYDNALGGGLSLDGETTAQIKLTVIIEDEVTHTPQCELFEPYSSHYVAPSSRLRSPSETNSHQMRVAKMDDTKMDKIDNTNTQPNVSEEDYSRLLFDYGDTDYDNLYTS